MEKKETIMETHRDRKGSTKQEKKRKQATKTE
jgi:hypothetical protein